MLVKAIYLAYKGSRRTVRLWPLLTVEKELSVHGAGLASAAVICSGAVFGPCGEVRVQAMHIHHSEAMQIRTWHMLDCVSSYPVIESGSVSGQDVEFFSP